MSGLFCQSSKKLNSLFMFLQITPQTRIIWEDLMNLNEAEAVVK